MARDLWLHDGSRTAPGLQVWKYLLRITPPISLSDAMCWQMFRAVLETGKWRSLVPTAETSCALTPEERGVCGRMQHTRTNSAHFIGSLGEFPGIDTSSGNSPRVACWFTTVGERSRKSRFTRACDEITAHRQCLTRCSSL